MRLVVVRFFVVKSLLMISCLAPLAWAQQPRGSDRNPRERANQEFEREAPKVGETIPEIELLDAEGKRLTTRDLRGNTTVLVFGCLT